MERVRECKFTGNGDGSVSLYIDTNKQTIEREFDSQEEMIEFVDSLELHIDLSETLQ